MQGVLLFSGGGGECISATVSSSLVIRPEFGFIKAESWVFLFIY